ncbi:hypothetical protein E4T47_08135 [Aureobasidium subglaciale]|nr:hypothetical protein E4T47_08135 [Aureobasidium subglaciale]
MRALDRNRTCDLLVIEVYAVLRHLYPRCFHVFVGHTYIHQTLRDDTDTREVSGPEEVVTGGALIYITKISEKSAIPIEDRVQEWEGMVSKVSRSGRGISSGQQNRVRHEGRHFESIDECRDG